MLALLFAARAAQLMTHVIGGEGCLYLSGSNDGLWRDGIELSQDAYGQDWCAGFGL